MGVGCFEGTLMEGMRSVRIHGLTKFFKNGTFGVFKNWRAEGEFYSIEFGMVDVGLWNVFVLPKTLIEIPADRITSQ